MAQRPPPRSSLPKVYEPNDVESRVYQSWMDAGFFKPKIQAGKKPFVVIMPPPNVTGELHVGHALTASIEDALSRWHRMRGDPVLWLPGKDHAGIATQMVVERQLAAEGLSRLEIGREKFLERVWEWVGLYGDRISRQHQGLGASCDWSREAFTMDPGPSKAVRTTFVNLFEKGLIYRGERLINWSPGLMTALSDLEVEHRDVPGSLWYMRYPFAEGDGHVTVATTRPETYLGDTAVAVNPEDARFRDLIGKSVVLPVIGRRIPIIADHAVDPKFGTGSVKVTPAHDPNDFEIGLRHGLEQITVLDLDATINDTGGPFAGMDRFDAREAIVEEFGRQGLLEKIEPHTHSVGHCQRSGVVVEPMLSKQWFVNLGSHKDSGSIAGKAHRAVASGEINIVPPRFTKVYLNWMEHIRDWCISRQLWWGHRIPVWYCGACEHQTVAVEDPPACEACGSRGIQQDQDVLDTWFSSALWPHSTLGWPDDTDDLRDFYPTTVMETGYDILFFWVARMIMMGLENTGKVPFTTVYLHGLIRDKQGDKMSKVKGNVVNPLDTIEEYGADALRFALTTGTSPGNDSRISTGKLESSRNFANKVWNASRYVIAAIDAVQDLDPALPASPALEDRWVLSRLDRTVEKVGELLEDFQLGEAQREIYEFTWSQFADWYIELAKTRLRRNAESSPLPVLVHVLESTLRLLHPFMPFLTEEVWQQLVRRLPQDRSRPPSIMVSSFPTPDPALRDPQAERDMGLLIDVITAIRNARADLKIAPSRSVEAVIEAADHEGLIAEKLHHIRALAKADPIRVCGSAETAHAADNARVTVLGGVRVIVPVDGAVDVEAERDRLRKQRDELRDVVQKLGSRLGNQAFVSKAPPAIVEKERLRMTGYTERLSKLEERLGELR